jgi:hypothetical protein
MGTDKPRAATRREERRIMLDRILEMHPRAVVDHQGATQNIVNRELGWAVS